MLIRVLNLCSSKGLLKIVSIVVALNFLLSLYLYINYENSLDKDSSLNINTNIVRQNLKVSFLDIGQGDSIFIETANGNSMLIDSGPTGGKVLNQISKTKNFFDKKIDVALITHTDSDHIGSMSDVIKNMMYKVLQNLE